MSLSTDLEVKHILMLADLYERQEDLKHKLSDVHDEIINLLCCMSEDDVNEAKVTYRNRLKEKYSYDGNF